MKYGNRPQSTSRLDNQQLFNLSPKVFRLIARDQWNPIYFDGRLQYYLHTDIAKRASFFRNKLIIDRLCLLHKFNSWQFSQEIILHEKLDIRLFYLIFFNTDNPLYSGLALVLSIRYALVASAARRVIAHSYAVLGYSSHKHLHYLHNTLG